MFEIWATVLVNLLFFSAMLFKYNVLVVNQHPLFKVGDEMDAPQNGVNAPNWY